MLVLARDPLCVDYKAQGKIVPATDADHIVALARGGDWSEDNGQGLCHSCHSLKTRRES